MKTKISLSFALSTLLLTSSFSVFAVETDAPSMARVDHHANHAADHSDAKGVVTLWKQQSFKMIPGGKMVPLGDPKTSFHILSSPEVADPNLEGHVLTALAADPTTETLFSLSSLVTPLLNVGKTIVSTALPVVTKIASSVFGAAKTVASNPEVQAAAIGAVATGIGAAATGAANVITNITAPKTTDATTSK